MTEINNKKWALRSANEPGGLTVHAESTKEFLVSLETEGLLHRSERSPFVWYTTDRGRAELAILDPGQGGKDPHG